MSRIHEVLAKATGVLSPEALRLGHQTDEEIASVAEEASFDLQHLEKRLAVRSKSQKLLVAHLYLDHIVSAMLSENVETPSALDLERMSFAQKLQLTQAIGLLGRDDVAMLKSLNGLRNQMSHKLDFEIDDAQVARLRSATPSGINDWAVQKSGGRRLSLGNLLLAIVLFTEFRRQAVKRAKLIGQRNSVHWAATMSEVNRAVRPKP